jgi:hypothetical protein
LFKYCEISFLQNKNEKGEEEELEAGNHLSKKPIDF